MSKQVKLATLLAVMVATLVGPAQAEVSDAKYLSNQTPYGDLATTPIVAPPADYEMFFIETIGRHGSRSLTSTSAETRALKLWTTARNKKALTANGKRFSADLKAFQKAERAVGYGNLTKLGKAEWAGIGRRTAANYTSYFTRAKNDRAPIAIITSTVFRTKQSAASFMLPLNAKVPGLTYKPYATDNKIRVLANGASTQGNNAIAAIKNLQAVRGTAKELLRTLYSRRFVDSLKDPVAAAQDIYRLYCTAAAMQGHTPVTFARYVPLPDAYMQGYMNDAGNYYRYGPGVTGQYSSYGRALPLLNDFLARLKARVDGDPTAAVFRFSHGETTMPFAALIRAPKSAQQTPLGQLFTHNKNPWRGYVAGLPGGNIEWVAYRNAAKDVLVTMRYNEEPVDFKAGCVATEPHFYTVTELKRCLLIP